VIEPLAIRLVDSPPVNNGESAPFMTWNRNNKPSLDLETGRRQSCAVSKLVDQATLSWSKTTVLEFSRLVGSSRHASSATAS